jgi:hypothetical protein
MRPYRHGGMRVESRMTRKVQVRFGGRRLETQVKLCAGRPPYFLLAFTGPKADAEAIKHRLTEFLRDELKLELSQAKTLISHAHTQPARFLGYEVVVCYANDWIDSHGERNINGAVALRLPQDVLEEKCSRYKRAGKPIHRSELLLNSDYDIVVRYQGEYRGIVQYYLLAQNVSWLNKLRWTMEVSLLKTLAGKHKTTVTVMAKKYQAETETPYGKMKCLRVVVEREHKKPLIAQFGGIPLRRRKQAILDDHVPTIKGPTRNDLITRLLADTCELCGSTEDCEVHHVRKLADLKKKGRAEKPLWVQRMIALRRKTLVVCRKCHAAIHAGQPTGTCSESKTGEPCDAKVSSTVRRGANGKGA